MLSVDELVTIDIDVPTAVTNAIGALPAIIALRAEAERVLPHFDLRNIDELETYTRATTHAHAVCMGGLIAPPEALGRCGSNARPSAARCIRTASLWRAEV